MSFTNAIHSAMNRFRNKSLLACEHQTAIDAKFFTYCWNYNQVDIVDYLVVEVEDITSHLQLDDASLFMDSIILESANNSQLVF